MVRILDAHGLMVFLEKEPGYRVVEECLNDAIQSGDNLLMTTVNYGEILYIVLRECGAEKANEIEKIMDTLPVTIVEAGLPLVREAAHLKAFHTLSYADCFAAALAKLNDCEVVTGDREFQTIEDEVKVMWVGRR